MSGASACRAWLTEGVLYLVRHGRTAANAEQRLQGRIDLPIDEVGRQQAAALPSALTTIDRVICSPLLRARQTAEVFGIEPEIDERWREMDYGVLEGLRLGDIPGEVWDAWIHDPHFAPEGGETMHSLANRIGEACEELIDQARTHEIVVVSHATPVKLGMAWALNAPPAMVWRSFVDQASITRIAMRDRGPVLLGFNVVPCEPHGLRPPR